MVTTANGQHFAGLRLILATGVVDELPEIPGLSQRRGKWALHCPYCHGYELDGRPIGVLAAAPIAINHALMLPDWAPTTFFINGMFEPNAEQLTSLERHRGTLERERVISIGGQTDVMLASGRVIKLEGLFTQPRTRLASPLAALLGCEF